MVQIHGLSTVLEDQVITPPTYSYMVPKHFHFNLTLGVSFFFVLLVPQYWI